MPLDGRAVALKQLRHLVGSKPHSLIREPNLNLRLSALRPKQYNLSVIHINYSLKVIVHHVVVVLLVMKIIIRLRTTSGAPIIMGATMTAAMIITVEVSVMWIRTIIAVIVPYEYIQIIKLLGIIGIIK